KLVRDELGVDSQAKIILFSSRLVVRKGLDVIIDAWPKILEEHPEALLLVLGNGVDQPDSVEEDVKKFVENTGLSGIKFLGESSTPERFCGISDVFVFPSRKEGFPNALLEAMTTGLPVVASRIGGVTDIVTSDHLGLLFRSDDSDDLADKLLLIMENHQKASDRCKKRREYMLENFSFELIASKYYFLYRSLIET
ncbi:MAG: glycosyltransferase family 4 protein, partial [Proteobacteria bacterium]|nr:glycosyltransferase family 4 protein [Pseudomonadota bacterium]